MAKDNELEEFGFEPIDQDTDLDEFGFEAEEEDMSQLEAAARGAAQGLTFDFADEIMGGAEAAWDVATGEPELKDLKELYQKHRDEQRKQMEQAAEEHPVTYYGSDIAAGVIPALLSGGATAAASVGKGALKAGAKQAAKTGAKFGAATGLGASEADLTEGEFGQAAKDVAVGTGLGAGLGVGLPLAGKAVGKTVSKGKDALKAIPDLIPGAEAIGLGYKAGQKGIKLTQEGIRDSIKDYSENLHKTIVKKLTKEGMDKKTAMELADEMGIRINAGEPIEELMESMVKKGAMGLKDAKEKAAFYNVLDDLVNGNDQSIKAIKKLEAKTAKQVAKDQHEFGARASVTKESVDEIDELLPLPEQQGKVQGLHTKMTIPASEGQEPVEYIIRNFQEILDSPIKLKQLDLSSMKPSEAEQLIQYINSFAGDISKPAKNITERNARQLAAELRDVSNKALESSDISSKNKNIANLYRALKKTGIKDRLRGSEEAVKDQIDKIRKKLAATGESSEIDKERLFEYLSKAGEEFKSPVEEGQFLNKLSNLSGMTEGIRTTNIRGLLGTAEGAVAKAANIAGRASQHISKVTKPVTGRVSKVANKIADMTDDQLIKSSEALLSSEKPAIKEMGQQLQYALQQEGPIKSAAIWSLSQQPAFRELVRKQLNQQEEEMAEDLGFEPTTIGDEPNPEEFGFEEVNVGREPNASEFLKEKEETRNTGYVPKGSSKSGVTIATGLDLGNFDINDLNISDELKAKLEPYVGLKGKDAEAVASNLSISDEEVSEIDQAMDVYISSKTTSLTEGIDESLVTDEFEEGLDSMYTNTPAAAKKLIQRVKSGDIDGAIDKGVEWNKTGGKFASGLLQRRMEELYKMFPEKADLIQSEGKIEYDKYQDQTKRSWDSINTIEELQKAKDRESKQLGSGAIPGTERSSLDDLMGQLQSLQGIDESERDQMEEAAMAGDMGMLQELMDQYKGTIS